MANKKSLDLENKNNSDIDIVNGILKALYSGPREKLAERLLKRFGSFHGIFRASREDLLKVEGMTEASAAFFSAAVAEFRQALRRAAKDIRLNSEYDMIYYAVAMDNESTEKYKLYIYTDASGKIIKYEKINYDNLKNTVGTACGVNASNVAVVEYGRRKKKASPDMASLNYTAELIKALNAVGIQFIDYIDYIGYKFCSLRRAIHGETDYAELRDASKEKYQKTPNFCEEVELYKKNREKSARERAAAQIR